MDRDSIDFSNENIPSLFRRIFIPTLLGMVCMSVMTLVDGAFVGHGVCSDALAAVNIFCPLWLLVSGFGLMFGIGCSVVASVHLSHSNLKAANINVTQAFLAGVFVVALWLLVELFSEQSARILGASDRLLPYVLDYQRWLSRSFVAIFLQSVGLMVIRLDGSPKYAMLCSSLPSVVNVVLDYVFVFVLGMGLEGVSIATSIGCWLGGLLVVFYFLFLNQTLHIYRLKFSTKSFLLTLRNLCAQAKLGFSAFLGDLFIAVLLFIGNYVFLKYQGEDGVAAFSVACYIFPFIFMTANAIAQSSQPIVSFNYGCGNSIRVEEALKVSLKTCLMLGFLIVFCIDFFVEYVVGAFVDTHSCAFDIAVYGIPLLSICFVPYIVNVALIGFCQSIENAGCATFFAILRGFILLIPAFLFMPVLFGNVGMWLAMPMSEFLTLVSFVFMLSFGRKFLFRKMLGNGKK